MKKTSNQFLAGPALVLLGLCLALAPVAQAAESDLSSTHTIAATTPQGSSAEVTMGYANAGPDTAPSAYINGFLPNPGGLELLLEVINQEGDGYTALQATATGTDTLGNDPQLFHDTNFCDNLLFQVQRTDDDPDANPVEGLDPGVSATFNYELPIPMENPNLGVVAVTAPESIATDYFGNISDILIANQMDAFARTSCDPLVGDPEDDICLNALEGNCWGRPISLLEEPIVGEFELVNDGTDNPTWGCEPLIGFTPGNIALVRRAECEFGVKGFNAELAGATALFMVNDGRCGDFPSSDDCALNMAPGDIGALVTIPMILVSVTDGEAIIAAYEAGETVMGAFGVGTTVGVQGYTYISDTADSDPDDSNDNSYARSTVVEASDPPVASFTYEVDDLMVMFTDTSTGAPTSWAWDFGDGNTSTDQNPSHTYAEADSYEVSLTVTNAGGSDTATETVRVGAVDVAYFIAAAALAEGAEGSFFQTDVDINASSDATYSFWWLPRGADNSSPTMSDPVSIAAGESVRVENVLETVFGATAPAIGALAVVADAADMKIMSRTYNVPTAKVSGTFGQAIPGIPASDLIMQDDVQRITFMSENDDLRANLGCVNGVNSGIRIMIDLYGNDGTLFESTFMDLGPWSNNQLNQVFGDYAPTNGYADVKSSSSGAAFYCYGSVVDNGSNDPTTVLPAISSDAMIYYVSAAALAEGAEGSFFQTDIDVNNTGTAEASYVFMWFPRGEDNSAPVQSDPVTLGAGMGARYENILSGVFGAEPPAIGAVGISSSNSADLLVNSRTYNVPTAKVSGTFGQAIPGVQEDMLIPTGEKKRIIFMSENDDFRANLGCISGTGVGTRINIELFDDTGASLEVKTMDLPPWSNNQLNQIFRDYAPTNGYADIWTTTEGAAVYCYGSVVDNGSNDPTTILPQ
jgi:PKD repeat protein